ncbi:barstar family protein [Chitinophaga barathri]|uniref:Barstar (barnase inhibitor) domain-containing protein n=1 Tax=Chitinophaga barathri TaxID=1647451 RepID=A0A3N4MQH0_9BACT|nr:barstar family protein [Chitinophaga barathri]RPD42360.1 hypothetical protein EG028_04060 [Chitinophaga barathri]
MKATYNATIDGKICIEIDGFYDEIARAFQFPDYFGRNLDALYDSLRELHGAEENYLLTITDFEYFLAEENEETRNKVIDILQDVSREWDDVPVTEITQPKSTLTIIVQ